MTRIPSGSNCSTGLGFLLPGVGSSWTGGNMPGYVRFVQRVKRHHPYQGFLKMQRTVETESRHIELRAAVSYEYDPEVLEYYPQLADCNEVIDGDGEIHPIDHTPIS